jgi:Family of unknown function (DUF5682)
MTAEPVAAAEVEVFGVRHHGPGSARSLVAALNLYGPDAVLIEGPADADPVLHWAVAEGMEPPIALLAYASDQPQVAAFWPFATFSPEWQALTWALRRGVPVSFCDLPAAMTLAARAGDDPDEPDAPLARIDPLRAMAQAGGYDDPERWWEDVVESRTDGSSPFPMLTEAMAELRADQELGPAAGMEARREAHMRSCIRAALKQGRQRLAVVCGAWHAPALQLPLPAASRDTAILRGAPKRKVSLTWVPWTHDRLATASGYGAGITSPGWYHHLWTAPDRPIVRWLTAVARSLRTKDLPVSSAHVIEAVRLAETLAALRGRPLAGLAEVTDATRAVLCDGDELAVRHVTDELVVGQALGTISPLVPTVPLEADLAATCRRLRLKREAKVRVHDLDLRRSIDQQRSVLFHRLRLLEVGWVTPAESGVQSRGTFRETWQSRWRPEHALAVVEAAIWGTTLVAAASARIDKISRDGSLGDLTAAVERCLLADLPAALERLLAALTDLAALDAEIEHLMAALPALAQAVRYGDVRRTETEALRKVSATLVTRICAGLSRAVAGLDDDAAATFRARLDEVHQAIGLLEAGSTAGLRARWLAALATLIDRPDLNGQLAGRVVRILLDAEQLADAHVRVERALSHGVPAAAKAAWVDGFFSDGALLLVHDPVLRGLLDAWVADLHDDEFVDLLPLVRRTFSTFTSSERRTIAERVVTAAPGQPAGAEAVVAVDDELAAPALATVARLLGWSVMGWS